ncbi:hypothetical protein NQ318_002092 [Aromia moschata]|uniref:Transcription elongation factor 1 homolog n=1 Tax=Aromia moschata TaxID=1265417 RepID=A0AAV8Y7B5_9CUCU|nr:hypothetical protein NQ318_002092 [Aromia moschata]
MHFTLHLTFQRYRTGPAYYRAYANPGAFAGSVSGVRMQGQEIHADKGRNTARITCRVCLEDFQTTINFLSEPVDVYNDWIDACESAN